MEENIKQIPSSPEAEGYVLGSILIENKLAVEFCSRLVDEDFYSTRNKEIFKAIKEVYESGAIVDFVSVIEQLKKVKKIESVTKEYVVELIDSVPSYVNAEAYVDVLRQKSIERELFYTTRDINRNILEGKTEFRTLLEEAEKKVKDIANKQNVTPFMPIDEATEKVMNIIKNNSKKDNKSLTGLDTGFSILNRYTYGFQKGELIILAARPGIGKSAFALNIATNACKLVNANVALFSLEMSIDQLVMRLISSASYVPLGKIRSGDLTPPEMSKVLIAKKELDRYKLYLDEGLTNNLEDIKVKCRKLKRENHLDLVIIDYLQLMNLTSGQDKLSTYEKVTRLSRGLKMLARELDVPILALSQLSRAVEKRTGKDEDKPILSDLRESGSIEQDADIVIFLHRKVIKSDENEQKNTGRTRKTDLIIAKNRQGETTDFKLAFKGDCSVFIEVE